MTVKEILLSNVTSFSFGQLQMFSSSVNAMRSKRVFQDFSVLGVMEVANYSPLIQEMVNL